MFKQEVPSLATESQRLAQSFPSNVSLQWSPHLQHIVPHTRSSKGHHF